MCFGLLQTTHINMDELTALQVVVIAQQYLIQSMEREIKRLKQGYGDTFDRLEEAESELEVYKTRISICGMCLATIRNELYNDLTTDCNYCKRYLCWRCTGECEDCQLYCCSVCCTDRVPKGDCCPKCRSADYWDKWQ